MHSLAAFIMRSRSTAALVAAVAGLLFWVFPPFLVASGAAVALVALRRGPVEGLWVAGVATLGMVALMWLSFGMVWPALRIVLPCWLAVWLLAMVLRNTISLALTFQAGAVMGLLVLISLYLILGDPTVWWVDLLDRLRQTVAEAAVPPSATDRAAMDGLFQVLQSWVPYLLGHIISALLWLVLAAVLLARWWQALLFNPSGFRPEFHGLRLGRPFAFFALVVFGVAMFAGWPPLTNFALVLSALYTLQGIAVVHAVLFKLQWSPAWLVLFYLLFVPLLSQVVMALGVVDAWADFRNRIQPRLNKR